MASATTTRRLRNLSQQLGTPYDDQHRPAIAPVSVVGSGTEIATVEAKHVLRQVTQPLCPLPTLVAAPRPSQNGLGGWFVGWHLPGLRKDRDQQWCRRVG